MTQHMLAMNLARPYLCLNLVSRLTTFSAIETKETKEGTNS
jgi:hypothetical protein